MSGISEREERCVVRSTRLGQRSASRPRPVQTQHQLPRSSSAVPVRLQQGPPAGKLPLRPRCLRTDAKPRRTDEPGGHERRPAVARSVRQRAGASRRRPSHLVSCPLHRRNARRPRRCRHLRNRLVKVYSLSFGSQLGAQSSAVSLSVCLSAVRNYMSDFTSRWWPPYPD